MTQSATRSRRSFFLNYPATTEASPLPPPHALPVSPPAWVHPIVVLAKTIAIVFLFIWVRATLPRLRYDQLMSLGWKVFLPRSEEHTSEHQSRQYLVCRLLLEKTTGLTCRHRLACRS